MANSMNKVAKELKNAIEASDERKPKPYDTQAEVLRVEDGTAWVHIPGGVEETPVRLTINAKEGDMVNIHVANGSAWITGNGTNPPTDDTRAEEVYAAAGQSIDFVSQLVDKDVTVKSITAATGYIDDLYSKNIHTDNIEAATGYIHDLTADNITAGDIVADHATIDSLDTHYAQIDIANVNNAWIEHGTIKKAEVFDENVFDLSGNRATLSRIDASKINVANLRADNLIVRRINGQPVVGGYTLIDSNSPGYSSKNPQALGWYEFVNAQWVLSTDTTVDMTKAYYQEGNEVSLYDQAYIDGLENSLQQQIDGAVETYTGTVVPTLVNEPYTDWYDTSVTPIHDERAKHVGDIYYVVNSAASENGYCYRFAYDNTSHAYSWVLIKDSDVTKALSDISELKTFESNTTSWIDETDEGLETIRTNHTTLAGVVDKTVKESIQLWYTKANTTAPNKPTAEVTSTSTAGNAWRKVVPAYNASYPNYYYCWQYKFVDGSFAWSDVVRDIAMGETQGTARDAKNTADLALPAADFQVFESTTFTDLVDEVDEQSTTMTNMTTRLGLNSDGTGSTTDIVAKESALEQTVNGISTRVGKTETHLMGMYATCSTAEATKAKVATIVPAIPSGTTWELTQGTTVTVKFTTANTHATPTLNVNSTGAKNIKSYDNAALDPDEYEWPAGSTFTFTYNGTNWLMQDSTVAVRMSSAETSITQNAEAIVSEAMSRESAVNLLLDSDAPNLGAVYASANRYISDASTTSEYVTANNVELTDPPEQGIKYARRFVCNGTNTMAVGRAYTFYNSSNNIIPYIPNTTYTATWWARCTNGQGQTNCHYPKFDGTTTNSTSERITLTSEWQKFTAVFTTGSAPNSNYNRIWFYARFLANTSGTIDICGCKLVAGDAVEAYSTKIEQTANNVLIQATASDTTAAQGGQHLIQSLINVAPSGVTIDASKVNITGVITAINNNTTTTINGGKITTNSITANQLAANSITIGDMNQDAKDQTLNSNVLVGGRNLLLNTARPRVSSASADGSAYPTPNPTLSEYGLGIMNNEDDYWTYSFDYKVTGNSAEGAFIYVQAKGSQASVPTTHGHYVINNPIGHFVHTFKLTDAQASSTSLLCRVRLRNATDGAILTVSNLKLEKGTKETDWTPAPEDGLNPNLLIGSQKMDTWYVSSDASKSTTGEFGVATLNGNSSAYTSRLDGRPSIKTSTAINGTPLWLSFDYTASIDTNLVFRFCGSDQKDGSPTLGTLTKYYQKTLSLPAASSYTRYVFNVPVLSTSDLTSVSSDVTTNSVFVRFYNRTDSSVLKIRRMKLEHGISNTGWCPSEEELQTCVTRIDEAGIRIHPSNTVNNSVVIDADGVYVLKGGTDKDTNSVAFYGDTARIGKESGKHINLTSTGVEICDGEGTWATFGESISIGGVYIDGDRFKISGLGDTVVDIGTGTGSIINGINSGIYYILCHYQTGLIGGLEPPSPYYLEGYGFCSLSEGGESYAIGDYSHASGYGVITRGSYQTAIGKFNNNSTSNAFEIGRGTDDDNRANIFVVTTGGSVNIASSQSYKVNGTVVASARAKTTITPSGCSNYSTYGGSYYEKAGNIVHVHVGVSGLTAATDTVIATLPSGYRPSSTVFGHGTGGAWNNLGYVDIHTDGKIHVRSESTYCGVDVTFIV